MRRQQDAEILRQNAGRAASRGFSTRQVSGSGNTCLFAAAAAHMIRLKERNLLTEEQKAILNRDLVHYTGVADLTIDDQLFSDENFIDGHLLLGVAIRHGILRSTEDGLRLLEQKGDADKLQGLDKEGEEALLDICPHLLLEKATIVQELDGGCQYSSFVNQGDVQLNDVERATAQNKGGEFTVFIHLGDRIPALYPECSEENFVSAQHFTAYITTRVEENAGQREFVGGGHYFYCRPIGEYPCDTVDHPNLDQPGIMKRVDSLSTNDPNYNWYNKEVIGRLKTLLQGRAHDVDAGGAAPAAAPVAHEGSTLYHEFELANVPPQEKSGLAKLIDWIIAGIKGFFNAFIYIFTLKWADNLMQNRSKAKSAKDLHAARKPQGGGFFNSRGEEAPSSEAERQQNQNSL